MAKLIKGTKENIDETAIKAAIAMGIDPSTLKTIDDAEWAKAVAFKYGTDDEIDCPCCDCSGRR